MGVMSTETDRLAGGWALTGFAWLAAGLWVVSALPWPLVPAGALLAVHGVRSLRLGRRLASGQNDPWRRKALARTLAVDVAVVAIVAAGRLMVR